MNNYGVFREMLDYVAHIADVTDADMRYCGDHIRIDGENEEQTISIEVYIRNKEVTEDGN